MRKTIILKVLYRELKDLKEVYKYYQDVNDYIGLTETSEKIEVLRDKINKIKRGK